MQLIMDKGTTDKTMPNDCHMIWNDKASLVYWFEDGAHVSSLSLESYGGVLLTTSAVGRDGQSPCLL